MLRFILILALYLHIILFSSVCFAAPWTFELAPYLWATNMNGKVGVGHVSATIDQSFSDLLRHLDFGAMLYGTAHKDNFGLYGNAMYIILSDSAERDHFINIHAKNHFGIFGAGISYIVWQHQFTNSQKISLEPYAGARTTLNNTTVTVNGFHFKKDVNWTDPVIGLRTAYNFNRCWATHLIGDIGGTNTSTHYSYSASAFLSYQGVKWQHVKTYLGYRFLKQHYETGSGINFYNWNMKLFGPVLGIGFIF